MVGPIECANCALGNQVSLQSRVLGHIRRCEMWYFLLFAFSDRKRR